MRGPAIAVLLVLAASAAAHEAPQVSDQFAPEIASSVRPRPLVRAKRWMAATANRNASEAAAAMLRAGGGAVDATIAAQFVLGLVEPQSSGLGGGGFLVLYDAAAKAVTTFDGRETAPMAATPDLFQDKKGEPLAFMEAALGGRAVGTPAAPRLMETVHRRFGKLPWPQLFEPAIQLAEKGFIVSPRLAAQIAADAPRLARDPTAAAYFLPGGIALKAGDRLKNPAYAETLKALRDGGASAFYRGPIAEDVVAAVRGARNPGQLSLEDLANYAVVERSPVCGGFRAYLICGMGPPSSGGIAVAQILGLLESSNIAGLGKDSPQAWRLIGDASRLAFADREAYVADPAFVPQPTAGLLAQDYLAGRAALLSGERALGSVAAGQPKQDRTQLFAPDPAIELPGTSHLSIVDADGNAVAFTTTIEASFGSKLMTRGFMLNSEMTDFSFRSQRGGAPVANRVEPGKRPRSSMAPTIVLKDGAPVFIVGSPGGSQIIGYVVKTLIAALDWGLDPAAAAALPNMLNRYGPFELEEGTAAETMAEPLRELGYGTRATALVSGVQAIAIGPEGILGGADPRREGVAVGE